MFVVIISENKFIDFNKAGLENLNLDFSNIISPKELSPLHSDIFNNYLLKRADAIITLTKEDQFNFYISKLCKTFYNTEKVITSINNSNNKDVFTSIGVVDIIDLNDYIKETIYNYLDEE